DLREEPRASSTWSRSDGPDLAFRSAGVLDSPEGARGRSARRNRSGAARVHGRVAAGRQPCGRVGGNDPRGRSLPIRSGRLLPCPARDRDPSPLAPARRGSPRMSAVSGGAAGRYPPAVRRGLPGLLFVLLVCAVYADPLFLRRSFAGRDLIPYNLP